MYNKVMRREYVRKRKLTERRNKDNSDNNRARRKVMKCQSERRKK